MDTYLCITAPGYTTVAAPLEKIPAYQRGGTILPYRERPRRSANAMQLDPFTLVAALTTQVRQNSRRREGNTRSTSVTG